MGSAPAVTVLCTGGRLWRLLLCVVPAFAAAALMYWAALHAGWQPAPGLWAALGGAAAAAAVAARTLSPAPQLNWDGAAWTCNGWLVRPQVTVDTGGAWMLLRLRSAEAAVADPALPALQPVGARAPRWLAVSQRDAPSAWHALRAAVYCRPLELPPDSNARRPP